MILAKGARSRELEDEVVARCALLGLSGAACGSKGEAEVFGQPAAGQKLKTRARDFWRLRPSEVKAEHSVAIGAKGPASPDTRRGAASLGATPIGVEELRWHFSAHVTPLGD